MIRNGSKYGIKKEQKDGWVPEKIPYSKINKRLYCAVRKMMITT